MIKCKLVNGTATFVVEGEMHHVHNITEEEFDGYVELAHEASSTTGDYNTEDFLMEIHPKMKAKREEYAAKQEEAKATHMSVVWDEEERKLGGPRLMAVSDDFTVDEDGVPFYSNYSVPIPKAVCEAVLEAAYNTDSRYTLASVLNFWQWCMLNPNAIARTELFLWLATGDFSITDSGMVIAQRCVDVKSGEMSDRNLETFVMNEYAKIKKWKKSVFNYFVYEKVEDNTFKLLDNQQTDEISSEYMRIGGLSDLYEKFTSADYHAAVSSGIVYTDHHTGTMSITMGKPVNIPREQCDEDSNAACSSGLHVMSKKYGLRLGGVAIYVLVNPMNVVAVPAYDNTKFRCCEYLPFGLVQKDDTGDVIPFEPGTYSVDYAAYSTKHLVELITKFEETDKPELTLHHFSLDIKLVKEMSEVLEKMQSTISQRVIVV